MVLGIFRRGFHDSVSVRQQPPSRATEVGEGTTEEDTTRTLNCSRSSMRTIYQGWNQQDCSGVVVGRAPEVGPLDP